MDVAILAGGKGTRLGLINKPKSMVDFGGIPLLHRQIIKIDDCKVIKKVFVLIGHLADSIKEYFEDKKFKNLKIFFIEELEPLGTAGAIKQLSKLVSNRFFVIYGDTYFDIDINRFLNFDKFKNCDYGTLFIHPNDHPYDSDLVEVENQKIKKFIPKPHGKCTLYRNYANAAFYILSKKIFELQIDFKNKDLGRDIFPLLPKNSFAAYLSSEFIKDVGTKERLIKTLNIYKSGIPISRNLKNKQNAIFLDRDGVINYEQEPFVNQNNFKIYEDLVGFLKHVRKKKFLVFIVTNQPNIAKGFISIKELELIHAKMEKFLLKKGLYFDEIVFCPHHPEKGHPGEIKKYKVNCDCRKPKNQMIMKLIEHYNVDIEKSILIGDRYRDVKAGNNSGLKTVLLTRGLNGNDRDLFPNAKPDFVFKSLTDLKKIIN
tara:strand:- start:171 stop:1457 length:1287 start_codon:yes stop_codon:yes gene_type:complete